MYLPCCFRQLNNGNLEDPFPSKYISLQILKQNSLNWDQRQIIMLKNFVFMYLVAFKVAILTIGKEK